MKTRMRGERMRSEDETDGKTPQKRKRRKKWLVYIFGYTS
jgi:hypothetical protein